jgi:hypothetical protein
MADTDSLRQVAQARAPLSAWLGIIFLFALFGMIVLAIIGPSPRGDRYEQIRAKKRLEILQAARGEAKSLNSYAWIDKSKGTVRIPIGRAMQLTATELAQKKPAAAGPIKLPQPAAPASPATAAPASSPAAAPSATPKAKTTEGPASENRGQPAATNNPPNAQPGTQPGAAVPPPAQSTTGTPTPPPGKTP